MDRELFEKEEEEEKISLTLYNSVSVNFSSKVICGTSYYFDTRNPSLSYSYKGGPKICHISVIRITAVHWNPAK